MSQNMWLGLKNMKLLSTDLSPFAARVRTQIRAKSLNIENENQHSCIEQITAKTPNLPEACNLWQKQQDKKLKNEWMDHMYYYFSNFKIL